MSSEATSDAPAPFTRGPQAKNSDDAVGRVAVSTVLRETRPGGSAAVRGNITRTFTVREARVSDVARVIERALYGDDA